MYLAFLIYFDINQKIILLKKKLVTFRKFLWPSQKSWTSIFVMNSKLLWPYCGTPLKVIAYLITSTYLLISITINVNSHMCIFFRNDLPLTLKVQIIIYSFFLHAPPIFYKFCSFLMYVQLFNTSSKTLFYFHSNSLIKWYS